MSELEPELEPRAGAETFLRLRLQPKVSASCGSGSILLIFTLQFYPTFSPFAGIYLLTLHFSFTFIFSNFFSSSTFHETQGTYVKEKKNFLSRSLHKFTEVSLTGLSKRDAFWLKAVSTDKSLVLYRGAEIFS